MTPEPRPFRVSRRYDELMREGKHGHYETLFRVVKEEVLLERERCARIAESFDAHQGWGDVDSIAHAIRSEEKVDD